MRRHQKAAVWKRGAAAAPVIAPTGFYLNGSTNTAFKAAKAAVLAGSSRAKIVIKNDSTNVGQGAGTGALGLDGARMLRPAKIMADALTAVGIPTLDNGIVNDNGMWVGSLTLPTYDTRVNLGSPAWSNFNSQQFAGGGTTLSNTGTYTVTEAGDTCELVYYNSNVSTLTVTVDGGAPASGPSSIVIANTGGFTKATIGASSVASHVWGLSANNTVGGFRSMNFYNSSSKAFDILVHGALGATSANQANNTGTNSNLQALTFDAPALTIINLGLNDMNTAVAVATYTANLQAIITAAKASGDVLLMFPHPSISGAGYNNNVSTFNANAKALAASNGVAYFSLWEYYGSAPLPASVFYDAIVHPKVAMYADIGAAMALAVRVMLQ